MKILNIILAAAFISLSVISCDKIEEPYYEEGVIQPPTTRVLLEDFTGQQCPQCPAAAVIAHDLQNLYGAENVIVVAIHAGWFSEPGDSPYEYDFRTEAGNEYEEYFKPILFPVGMIDRINENGSHLVDKDDWGTIVSQRVYGIKPMELTIKASNTDTLISGSIEIDFITALDSESYIQIWITEDHVIKPQTGQGAEYEHNHVLRGAVNGSWGEKLKLSSYAENTSETIEFKDFRIGDDWVMENLSIVAYVYDGESKKVLQVNQKKLSE